MRLIDFIQSFDGTIDVYDNYTGELNLAYCGEKLTVEGMKEFREILDLEIKLNNGGLEIIVDEREINESECDKRIELLTQMFSSMAGYCSEENYNKWFTIKFEEVELEDDPEAHCCNYNSDGMCEICGAIRYGSYLYRELYGGE